MVEKQSSETSYTTILVMSLAFCSTAQEAIGRRWTRLTAAGHADLSHLHNGCGSPCTLKEITDFGQDQLAFDGIISVVLRG